MRKDRINDPWALSLRSLDPLSKLVALLCLAVLAMHWDRPLPLVVMLVILIVTAKYGAGMTWKQLSKRMLYIGLFGLPLFILSAFAVPSEGMEDLTWGGTFISGSVLYALAITVRMFCLFLSSLIYIETTDAKDFVIVMTTYLRLPYRFVFGVSMALTFLPLLAAEGKMAGEARKIRYGRKPNGVKELLRIWKSNLISVFIGAIRRVEQTAGSMEAKGFGAYPERTFLREVRIQLKGYSLMCISLIGVGILWFIV